jgi:uncharacterized protein (TIGR03067 family)
MHALLLMVAALILLATPVAARCEVYKSIDPNGRVIYSDKPAAASAPTTNKPAAAGIATSGLRELEGTWDVAGVTFEGAPSLNNKLLNGKWSFANNELAIEAPNGEKLRYSVRIEPGYPATFAVTPIAAANERGGWMIYTREGSRLRIAFFDNLETRPTGFEPQRKLAVVTLLPRNAAGARTEVAKRTACDILRAAGVEALLGPTMAVETDRITDPAAQCRFGQLAGAVALQLIFATDRSALDKQREREQKDAQTRAVRTTVQDEPQLGRSAFSVRMGNRVMVWTLKGDTVAALSVELPASAHGQIVPFAQRVVENL